MNKFFLYRRCLQLAMVTLLALPELSSAQNFTAGNGDLVAGFRKTGSFTGNYELVVNIGSVTNFLAVPAGNSISISNYSPSQLSAAFSDYNNLQWSVSSMVVGSPGYTWLGFERDTIWFTLPRTTVNMQTTPLARGTTTAQGAVRSKISGFFNGGYTLSSSQGSTNANNNSEVVIEPTAGANGNDYASFVADPSDSAIGDFDGTMPTTVENTTPASFTSAVVSDLYQSVPTTFADPNQGGSTSGNAYYVGYFTLNPDGTMTFTRASNVAVPVADFSGAPTTGFAPLQVVFTDASTGSITNWVWNFGDGHAITNSAGINATNTYATAGNYTVTLTVIGAGGSNTSAQTGYVVASPTPQIGNVKLSGGHLVFSGTNCPTGLQYRILSSTNVALPVASWTPVLTNTFLGDGSFSYTNLGTNSIGFFRLVSP